MRISCDPDMRRKTVVERGPDFEDALRVFASRLVVVGYTARGNVRHIFSMRKANGREEKRVAPLLEI